MNIVDEGLVEYTHLLNTTSFTLGLMCDNFEQIDVFYLLIYFDDSIFISPIIPKYQKTRALAWSQGVLD